MRFKLEAASCYSWEENKELYDILVPFCEVEGENLILDIKYISELKCLLSAISSKNYKCDWDSIDSFIIDFSNNIISLYDNYIE